MIDEGRSYIDEAMAEKSDKPNCELHYVKIYDWILKESQHPWRKKAVNYRERFPFGQHCGIEEMPWMI